MSRIIIRIIPAGGGCGSFIAILIVIAFLGSIVVAVPLGIAVSIAEIIPPTLLLIIAIIALIWVSIYLWKNRKDIWF
jgi:hypothetical protein